MTEIKAQSGWRKPALPTEALQAAEAASPDLTGRLDAYSRFSRAAFPEVNAAYDALIQRLGVLQDAGPAIGEEMPEFLLFDHEGRHATLTGLLEQGPLVLSFNRGHWCPWCRLELRAIAEMDAKVKNLGGQIVSVAPETAAYSGRMAAENNLPFRVLIDLDLSYALSIGLAFWVGEDIRQHYQKLGLDLALFHNNGLWFLPAPATFVIDQEAKVRARFVNPDFRKRMEPSDILDTLNALKSAF